MRISDIKIDDDFKACLPELTTDEYTNLEKSIIKNGVISPLVLWHGFLVDGHNRYSICKAHSIEEVPVKDIDVDSKDGVLEWILSNQLSRRNLNDHQRNVIALRYEEVIRERARTKQSAAGGDKKSDYARKIASDQMIKSDSISTRKELAQIAGTSEASVQRSKLILEQGTEEQKERAMHGGKGNSVSAIAKEIKAESEPQRICTRCGKAKPLKQMTRNGASYVCLECERKRCREKEMKKAIDADEYRSIDKTVERIKSGEFSPYTREDVLEEMKRVADGMKQAWDAILEEHAEFANDETIVVDAFSYMGKIFKEDKRYVEFV